MFEFLVEEKAMTAQTVCLELPVALFQRVSIQVPDAAR